MCRHVTVQARQVRVDLGLHLTFQGPDATTGKLPDNEQPADSQTTQTRTVTPPVVAGPRLEHSCTFGNDYHINQLATRASK